MTDTSVPADDETTAAADASPATADAGSTTAPAGTDSPESPTTPAGASAPVTEHPAHDMVSELLDALRLQGVEHVFRSVFEWLGRHASEIGGIAGEIAPVAETAAADAAKVEGA